MRASLAEAALHYFSHSEHLEKLAGWQTPPADGTEMTLLDVSQAAAVGEAHLTRPPVKLSPYARTNFISMLVSTPDQKHALSTGTAAWRSELLRPCSRAVSPSAREGTARKLPS